jgi:hypothetical protein
MEKKQINISETVMWRVTDSMLGKHAEMKINKKETMKLTHLFFSRDNIAFIFSVRYRVAKI